MIIRQMRREDIGQVYRIICSCLDEYYVPETLNFFIMQWSKGQLVACDTVGKIHGFLCSAMLDNGKCTISLFAVDPMNQNMGIGNDLLNEFRKTAMMHGLNAIQLEVRECNSKAIRFYEKRGFLKTGFLEHFYNDGGNAFRMISGTLIGS